MRVLSRVCLLTHPERRSVRTADGGDVSAWRILLSTQSLKLQRPTCGGWGGWGGGGSAPPVADPRPQSPNCHLTCLESGAGSHPRGWHPWRELASSLKLVTPASLCPKRAVISSERFSTFLLLVALLKPALCFRLACYHNLLK